MKKRWRLISALTIAGLLLVISDVPSDAAPSSSQGIVL
jgi:hypothetical protein